MNEPWEDLPKKAQDVILHGSGEDEIKFIYDDGMRRYDTKKEFEGVIPNMERRYSETDTAWIREDLERYQDRAPCDVCNGYRLKPEALCGEDRRAAYRPGLREVDPRSPTPGSATSTRS